MKFECYSNLHQLPASADSLFAHNCKQSMFLSREWFESLVAATGEAGQSLSLVSVVDEGSVLALLPLTGENGRWQSFSHRYTALYSLLLAPEHQAEVLACLAKGLSQMPAHSLQLSPVDADDAKLLGLRQALEACGYDYHQHFSFYNWIHRTRGQSFDDYMAERPARLRGTIARKRRKLEREHECRMQMFTGDQVARGLKDYHAAYAASWKAYEQYADLLDTAAIKLSEPGWTRLAVLYIDGQAAAAQLWFVVQGKASIFRLAYDENWKRYSPGSILTAWLMQHVIDIDKVEEIDFLTGNEAYKQDWMSERRQRWRLLFVQRQPVQSGPGRLMGRLKKASRAILGKQKASVR